MKTVSCRKPGVVLPAAPGSGNRHASRTPPEIFFAFVPRQDLNREFPIDPETWQYFTFLCATLDVRSSELRFTSAGHPGPVYIPRSGGPATVDAPGFPIGLFREASYGEHRLMLQVGDRVYFYSDGATDAVD